MTHTALAAVRGAAARQQAQEAAEQSRAEIVERFEDADDLSDLSTGVAYMLRETERIHEDGNLTESEVNQEETGVFDTMSMDYGDEAAGFKYYQIPEAYTINGGYLPEEVQIYTYCLCKERGVRYALILAMIEHESGYEYDCIGDDGESLGYMQVMQRCHEDRMEELGATDLMNPYQNINVGVDYIAELIEKYGTIQDALTAYNYGEAGAKANLWNNGIYVYDYNEGIMSRMKEIEEELGQ